MIQVSCAYCKKIFLSRPLRYNFKRHFCSQKCVGLWVKKNLSGSNAHQWSRTKTKCSYCKKVIFVVKYKMKKFKNHFCNNTCTGKWKSENLVGVKNPHRKRIRLQCSFCKKFLSLKPSVAKRFKNHYCNRTCAGKWLSKNLIGKKNPFYGKTHSKATCDFIRFNNSGCRNYGWKGGLSLIDYPSEFNEVLKKFIRNRDNFRCQLCNIHQKRFRMALPIHHIDYNKKNNKKNNLITLCQKCNNKVNVNRGYWTIFFQNKLMETYSYECV